MDTRWRQGAIFAAGLAFGGLLAAGAFFGTRSADDAVPVAAAPVTTPAATSAVQPPDALRPVSVQPAAPRDCSYEPLAAKAGPGDGAITRLEAGAELAGGVRTAIVQGKEAMAGGRDRDAEVAFLNACRVAAAASPAQPLETADAKYQLARHYASLAQEQRAPRRAELLKRAKPLYEDSLRIYLAQLGGKHEKTRFAAEGLASLKQESAQAPARPTRAPTPQAIAPEQPPVVAQASGAARVPDVPAQPQPSFDCEKAKSTPEKMICGDADLARLDRELGTLYARAKRAAHDVEAFQRVSDREWRRRESECGDRDCLVRWYAERRQQLQEQIAAEEQLSLAR